MKKIFYLNSLVVLLVIYVPSLILRLLSRDQVYSPIDRSTLSLLSSVWLTCFQIIWLWASGICIAAKLKQSTNRNLAIFKASLYIPIAYVMLPIATLTSMLIPINILFPFLTFEFYGYLHTVSLLCFIYPIYFISRYLTAFEHNRPTEFNEYISTFLAIVLFPIGVFFIQPRIRKVVNSDSANLVNY